MLAPMTSDPLADVVSTQYERWVYPAPIVDLPAWLESSWQWFDPSHAHRLMWPDRDYWPGMDILVAGCGTNQAAVIAYTNPQARVVAIDVSDASLSHHRYLADTYELSNLELHRLPIEDVSSLGRDFDLIMTTGVLHHLADPAVGMRALAQCLRPDGVLAVMLYATYGRYGVHLMQSVFRDMGMSQDEESVRRVRDAIAQLPSGHPLQSYLGIAPDLDDDAGIVDTFLHGRERTYTIDECVELVASSGLVFQDLFLKTSYYAPQQSESIFLSSVAALPRERQWSIMERINSANACHFFLACRADRPRETYAIDFSVGDPLRYIPELRQGCRLDGDMLSRHDWSLELSASQAALVGLADGRCSIGDIVDGVMASGPLSRMERDVVARSALSTFETLWKRDFMAMGLPAS